MPEEKKEKKEFTDEQILAANILAAIYPGMFASHGQMHRAETDATDAAKRIIAIVKSKF